MGVGPSRIVVRESVVLKNPPVLTVRRTFPRPDLTLVDKLLGAQTGHVTDAMFGRGALDI